MSAYSRSTSLSAYQSVAAHGGVAAADPHGLITMLMDGALQRLSAARGASSTAPRSPRAADPPRGSKSSMSCAPSLNFEAGGEIAANMANLYDYTSAC